MNDKELMEKVKKLYLQDAHSETQYVTLWMEEIVFSWRWWVSVVLAAAFQFHGVEVPPRLESRT